MKTFKTKLGNYYGVVEIVIDKQCKLSIDNFDKENTIDISKKLAYMMVRELCDKNQTFNSLFIAGK